MSTSKKSMTGILCVAVIGTGAYVGYVTWQQSMVDDCLVAFKEKGSLVPGLEMAIDEVSKSFASRDLRLMFRWRGFSDMPLTADCHWRLGLVPDIVVSDFRMPKETTPAHQALLAQLAPKMTVDFGFPFMPKSMRLTWQDAGQNGQTIAHGEAAADFSLIKEKAKIVDEKPVYGVNAQGLSYHRLPYDDDYIFKSFVFKLDWAGEKVLYRYLPDDPEPLLLTVKGDGFTFDDVTLGRHNARWSVANRSGRWSLDVKSEAAFQAKPGDTDDERAVEPIRALERWKVDASLTTPTDVWFPGLLMRTLGGETACRIPGICRSDAQTTWTEVENAARKGEVRFDVSTFEIAFPNLALSATGTARWQVKPAHAAMFDVTVKALPLSEAKKRANPEVQMLHDAVAMLKDEELLQCTDRECRASIVVDVSEETDEPELRVNGRLVEDLF